METGRMEYLLPQQGGEQTQPYIDRMNHGNHHKHET